MKEVPAKIDHNNEWVVVKLGIDEDKIVISEPINQKIQFESIVDLIEKSNTLIVTFITNEERILKIKSVNKVLEILKKLILNSCDANYRLLAYYKSPAMRGGALIKDAKWEKGNVVVVKNGIWFVNPTKQYSVSIQDVKSIELAKTEVKGKTVDIIKIDHLGSGEIMSSQVLCPTANLQLFYKFLKNGNKEAEIEGDKIDATEKQVMVLIQSGVDSQSIENMLNIPHEKLDAIYDRFLELKFAEVVTTRREIKMTGKGVKYILERTKSKIK